MDSFLTPESISVAVGVIVVLFGITYSKLKETNVEPAQRTAISIKTSLFVTALLLVVWAILYGIILLITNQQPDGFNTLTSGLAGVVLIVMSFIISREVINRVVRRWS